MSIYFGDKRPFQRLLDKADEGGASGGASEGGANDGGEGSGDDGAGDKDGDGADAGEKPAEGEGKEAASLVTDPDKKETEKPSEGSNVAPEKYDLKLPENSGLKDSVVTEVEEFARANNLSNEAAQALLDREGNARKAGISELTSAANEQAATWLKESKADPEIGGDKWDASVQLADYALDQLFPGLEIKKFMNETGMGNNPTIIKGFKKIGEMLKPTKIDPSGDPLAERKSKLSKFYDHPTSQQKTS